MPGKETGNRAQAGSIVFGAGASKQASFLLLRFLILVAEKTFSLRTTAPAVLVQL